MADVTAPRVTWELTLDKPASGLLSVSCLAIHGQAMLLVVGPWMTTTPVAAAATAGRRKPAGHARIAELIENPLVLQWEIRVGSRPWVARLPCTMQLQL